MAKMIPGRVRNQGIILYDEGAVSFIENQRGQLLFTVAEASVIYDKEDALQSCSCDLFAQKRYCEHLAAVEYFLKNDPQGKTLDQSLKSSMVMADGQVLSIEQGFGRLFLDRLRLQEEAELTYQLSVEGEQSPFSSVLWWTLKIKRLPDERVYIVRDIGSFLSAVKREADYQIGRQYYEPLSFWQFDQPSQDLISFLWRLLPESERPKADHPLLPNYGRYVIFPSGLFEEGLRLLNQLWAFELVIGEHSYLQTSVEVLQASDGLYHFDVTVHQDEIALSITEEATHAFFDGHYLFCAGNFYRLTLVQQRLVTAIKNLPLEADLTRKVLVAFEDQEKLAARLSDFSHLGVVRAPKQFEVRSFIPYFTFDLLTNGRVGLEMAYDYDGWLINTPIQKQGLPFISDAKKEAKIKRLQETEGFSAGFSTMGPVYDQQGWYRFFTQTLPDFEGLGQVTVSDQLMALRSFEKPAIKVNFEGGLLDVAFDFSSLVEEDIADALKALLDHQTHFVARSGQLVIFDEETQRISDRLKQLRAKPAKNGHLHLDAMAAYHLSDGFGDMASVSVSKDFETLAYDLVHPETFTLPDIKVRATMRDYQRFGVQWLSMLHHYGFGGILADDMGLGKTLQTIAFLSTVLSENRKVLILAPAGLIYNWQEEFEKFAPDLDSAVAHGSKPLREGVIAEQHQVTITSYASFRQDYDAYSQYQYDYLILDEAQVMKNTQTKIAQSLRAFNVTYCYALSGTPIENKLLEIWSIFQIVLPGLLPSKKTFLKWSPEKVAHHIKPFMLRRRKEEVLPELPDLIEMTYHNELDEQQKAIYLAQLRQMQTQISQSTEAEFNRSKIEILSGITRLRQICDTPKLFMPYDGKSGKIESLRQLLLQIKENGHRALIFSQFRGMLDIAEEELSQLGLTVYKLTGSTPAKERQQMTHAFNKGSRDAFLISLKAGGVGLNLTGADTVVLIDLWWNPAVEMQAISRAHRLGQESNVEVYRLITSGTIEEKILELQDTKRHLVTTVLDGNETRASLTLDDIKAILGIGD